MLKCNRCGRRRTAHEDSSFTPTRVLALIAAETAEKLHERENVLIWPSTELISCFECADQAADLLNFFYSSKSNEEGK